MPQSCTRVWLKIMLSYDSVGLWLLPPGKEPKVSTRLLERYTVSEMPAVFCSLFCLPVPACGGSKPPQSFCQDSTHHGCRCLRAAGVNPRPTMLCGISGRTIPVVLANRCGDPYSLPYILYVAELSPQHPVLPAAAMLQLCYNRSGALEKFFGIRYDMPVKGSQAFAADQILKGGISP